MRLLIQKICNDPMSIIRYLAEKHFLDWMNDTNHAKLLYYANRYQHLNLNDPKEFGEKIQWLKLFDRKEKYSIMVDKYAVKSYIAHMIGERYVVPV